MITADLIRELEKAREALRWAEEHLARTNEANAALHCNERVFYSPLTTQVHNARESLGRVIEDLTFDAAEEAMAEVRQPAEGHPVPMPSMDAAGQMWWKGRPWPDGEAAS